MTAPPKHLLLLLSVLTITHLNAQELDIKRSKTILKPIQEEGLPAGWKKLGDDLFKVRFRLPYLPERMRTRPGGDRNAGQMFSKIELQSAQQVFESIGVPFDELASATFDPATSILTVINSAENINLINVYTDSYVGSGPPIDIAVRLEIYEVTKLQALQLQESTGASADHTPERQAALAAVREGNAKLSSILSVSGAQGQRAKLTDGIESTYQANSTKDEPVSPASVQVGTKLEAEPNLSADGETINLNISVKYYTAPPQPAQERHPAAKPTRHTKSILTNIELIDGNYILLGNWTPTGKLEQVNSDTVQVAFVTASKQQVKDGDWGIITVDENQQ